MNTHEYLNRIDYWHKIAADTETLFDLHKQHIFNVPFENLDVYYKKLFTIEPETVYQKVVVHYRGGFCYELNQLFHSLLTKIGFNSRIIAARIIDEAGNIGPAYDHMCLHVTTDKEYLADVGYGDLFIQPLEIRESVQHDGRNYFKLERNDHDFLLWMSADGTDFQKKYMFNLTEVSLSDFEKPCLDKQLNPDSYFVRNVICTKPTPTGRITVFNDKLIEKKEDQRLDTLITNDSELEHYLKTKFGITVKKQLTELP